MLYRKAADGPRSRVLQRKDPFMLRALLRIFPLMLVLAVPAAHAAEAQRQLVKLPPMMQQHMLHNMRDHLLTLNAILGYLAAGKYEQASAIAESRLGMSSLGLHGAAHMAPFMPEPMRKIGTAMHRAASRFARSAQAASVDHNLAGTLKDLSAVTRQCTACHAAYRIH
jgi:hypothetical protein